MYKRCLVLFSIIMGLFCYLFFDLDYLSKREKLYDAAINQQSYKLKVADTRGTIYDCRNIPLVNTDKKLISAVIPSTESLQLLTPVVSQSRAEELYKKCSGSTPFTIETKKFVSSPLVRTFEIPIRYSGLTMLPHILGYVSTEGYGITGIEKIYDKYLECANNEIYVKYNMDATGKFLSGTKEITKDSSYMSARGVSLNIDSRIQAIVEDVANRYIDRGCVIVTEVPNCEIRACCSIPSFMPQSVGDYLDDKNSPLLNRTFCEFNLGSIFKLVTAAAALEQGINPDFRYDCSGKIQVEDAKFRCFNSKKHGDINLEEAIAQSCNGYFVELSKYMPSNAILKMAKKFGFGEGVTLVSDMKSKNGVLPDEKSLENPKNLANFSFGQGKLLVTPIQVSALINTIASDGKYSNPKLVKGLISESMHLVKDEKNVPKDVSYQAISKKNAEILKKSMKSAVDYGTAQKGKTDVVETASKTSTAQTGIIEDGRKIEQSWIGGMFPYDNPKYSIVVLSEAGHGGGESCGPVFKDIVEELYKGAPELFVK